MREAIDPAAILARYGSRVPRYTSYPAAPHFEDAAGPSVQAAMIAACDPSDPVSVYLHIPFCDRLCWFCGCHTKMTKRYAPIAAYVDSLVAEMALFRASVGTPLKLARLHLGGGSPSILRRGEFARLKQALDESFDILPDAEIAVEIDPSDVGEETLEGFRLLGVNRASIGVQDFDPDVQAAINRPQSFQVTRDVVTALRETTGAAVNIDALYGLPRQTPDRLARTIDQVIALAPDRVALFGYAHVPWMKTHQRMIHERDLPAERQRFDDAAMAATRLTAAGFRAIGIDHFAREHDPLAIAARQKRLARNFQGYTADACATLLGFGASAISRYSGGYVQNVVATGQYREAVATGLLPAARGYASSDDDRLRAHAIERLLCDFVLDLAEFEARFGLPARPALQGALAKVAADPFALATVEAGQLAITEQGRPFARIVASWFDAKLDSGSGRYSKAI